MDAQDPIVTNPSPAETQAPIAAPAPTKASPEFPDLIKASFQFLTRFWLHYLKLGFLLAIPAIVVFLVLGYFVLFPFLQSILGFGGFEAHASPALPASVQVTAAPVPDPAPEPEMAPVGIEPISEEIAPEAEVVESAPVQEPSLSPLGKPKSMWDNPEEGVGPTAFGTPDLERASLISTLTEGQGVFGLLSLAVVPFLLGLLAIVYNLVFMLSFARLTVVLERGEESGAIQMIKWAFRHVWTYLAVVLRIFTYTLLWIPIVAIFAAPVFGFLGGAGILNASAMMILSYALGLLALVSIPLAFIRMPRTLWAHFVLADRECESKEALDHSVEISIGHWWQIVLYLLGIGIVSSMVSGILSSVIGKINVFAGGLVSLFLSILVMFYVVIFNFGMYRMLESQFRPQK
jgi:hypothetical protein